MSETTPAIPTAPAMPGPRGKPAALGFIYAAVMMNTISMGVIAPVFPTLVKSLTGQGDAGAAQIMGVFGAVWALMQLTFAFALRRVPGLPGLPILIAAGLLGVALVLSFRFARRDAQAPQAA